MKSIRPISLAIVLSVGLSAACDVVEDPVKPTGATLKITTPAAVTVYPDRQEGGKHKVDFTVSKFVLAPQGTCGNDPSCGHTQVLFDSGKCARAGAKGPYFTQGAETEFTVDVADCGATNFWGDHDVIVRLVKDDDTTPVSDSIGGPVWAHVKLTERPTFNGTVKGILGAKCAPCHTTGASGGVNFAAVYEDGKKPVNDDVKSCVTVDEKTNKITAKKTVADCALVRVQKGEMPLGAGCTGDPAKDSGNPACLTADEQSALSAYLAQNKPEAM